MKNLKIKIYTLGCKVNQYDSGRLAAELESAGFAIVEKAADLAIVNSCAVTETAMIKSGRVIKLATKENPGAKVVLAGCWARLTDQEIEGVDVVLKSGDVKELIKKIFNFQFSIFNQIQNHNDQNDKIIASGNRARYFIKIQDGCEQYCSYCIVPYTRGKLASRGAREVIDEITRTVKAGYREIVLSGIHLGLYGKEDTRCPWDTECLMGLLKKLIKIINLGRIRLSSIEITEVTDELIKLMVSSGKICRHLHIPVQSGSNKILKLMNRPYTIKNYELRITNIRKAIPDIAISTDVIAGFPGETAADFKETVKFIKRMKFSRLHVFPFSAHAQTPAAKFPGQVEEKFKARRAKNLRQLGLKLAEDYKNKFKGRKLEIVIEQIKPDRIMGKTEYYFDVEAGRKSIKNKKLKIGEIIKIKF